jgi:predicted DNA binding CopG/RHH family protein
MKKAIQPPTFANEDEEATWWASRQGREFLKQKSAEPQKKVAKGSRLVGQLNPAASVQIALRLPGPDVEKARELAAHKGIGYQTLLKMLVHEGLQREARRARSADAIPALLPTSATTVMVCIVLSSGRWRPCETASNSSSAVLIAGGLLR